MKCPHCNKEFNLKEQKMRSLPENKYYWAVCLKILSEETGYTAEEMHELCRTLFLNEKITLKVRGEIKVKTIPVSTTGLTTIEFEEYLSRIREFASSDLGIFIPLPNENILPSGSA